MFPEELRKLRKQKNLNQAGLAEIVGMSQATIAAWEKGTRKPDVETISYLADFFGVSVDYLMGRDEPAATTSPESQMLWQQEKALLEQMTPEQRDRVKEYMRFLLSQQNSEA